MRIYQKLNIIILGLVLIPFSIASLLFFYNSEKDLKKEIFSALNTVADFKAARIQDFFAERKNDMDIYVNRYIVKLATALKRVYRASDIIARIGGDEFAILTIKTKESDIPLIIKRLNEAIDNLNAADLSSSPKLSVTIGVAHCDPSSRCLLKDLLDEADRIMYSNKRKL